MPRNWPLYYAVAQPLMFDTLVERGDHERTHGTGAHSVLEAAIIYGMTYADDFPSSAFC
jgi:hypothetical protein